MVTCTNMQLNDKTRMVVLLFSLKQTMVHFYWYICLIFRNLDEFFELCGAAEARRAHNPEVLGSKPSVARKSTVFFIFYFLFLALRKQIKNKTTKYLQMERINCTQALLHLSIYMASYHTITQEL